MEELRKTKVLPNIESLTNNASETANEVRNLITSVLDEPNKKALKGGVKSLTRSLEHIENGLEKVSDSVDNKEILEKLVRIAEAFGRLADE